ncbi:UDP-2,4-diacetamido-2,4,6-trideoxy-beta-L-altropyranose hydrolase [Pseudofulvibacter geojedonensis]|uniref:UDP-2,4-diacetamido-2,4, 6-trideoxy-beta-L-altropyranose hydrolase n=1 Tax=Pseudofulvibacter geojedonensis TaxID=1123758 RepID=A0ABW3HZK9_9FLAO
MKKIICRADGNAKTGLGHLYRMLAIAAFYQEDYELIFLTKQSSIASIIPKEYNLQFIPENITIELEPQWLSANYLSSKYIVIADGYQFVSAYQKALKELGYTLFYIDDLAVEHMYADVVINHSLHFTPELFKAEEYTQYGLGTNFAMLRPKFCQAAKLNRNISSIEDAFVCFGGADQYDLSLKAAKALLKKKQIKTIHVVLGGAYSHQSIYNLANENPQLFLYKNLSEDLLYNLMARCQMAVAPSSTILYELCSVKMPILSGYFVDNQKNINSDLSKRGVIFNGGDFSKYAVTDFEIEIDKVLYSKEINSCLLKQQNLFDGKSKQRFLNLMEQFQITSRKATAEDVMLVYNWSNDILVRQNSFQSAPINLESHTKWFLDKIKDPEVLFLIIEVNNKPAGVVRYKLNKTNSVVGVIVSNDFRGKRLSSAFLEEGSKKYFEMSDKPIYAYIKKENIASVKAFEKAKYVYLKEENIEGNSSFVYKLEKYNVIR